MIQIDDDIDRIMAVMACAFDPAFGEGWSRRQLLGALEQGNCRYLLTDPQAGTGAMDGETAGFALVRTVLHEQELLLLAIRPGDRARGLGRALLARVIADARARGAGRLLLEMRRNNGAERLYRAQGFVPVGERANYYRAGNGDRIDAITFALDLISGVK